MYIYVFFEEERERERGPWPGSACGLDPSGRKEGRERERQRELASERENNTWRVHVAKGHN